MPADGVDDVEGQGERAVAVFQGYGWRGTLLHRAQKRFQLRVQRFLRSYWRFADRNLRIHRGGSGRALPSAVLSDRENQNLLASVVERDVLARLKEAQL